MSISIDFETYATVELKTAGAWRYAEHPDTRAICVAVVTDAGSELVILDDGVKTAPAQPPAILAEALARGERVDAWNSLFEWCIWHLCLKWPALPLDRWHDTAAQAATCGLPRALGDCADALGMPLDQRKQAAGKALINILSKPSYGRRNTDPALLAEFYDYCLQDALVERAVGKRLPAMSERERDIWLLDQAINIRGVGIDVDRVADAIMIAEQERKILDKRIGELTGGAVTAATQRQRIVEYCNAERGDSLAPITSLTVKTLPVEIANEANPQHVRDVLVCRAASSKSSVAKYGSLDMLVGADNRAHGLLRYHGAHTGRWTGQLFQPQNLPRGEIENPTAAIELFKHRDRDVIDMCVGDPMTVLSGCVRGMLIPTNSETFAVVDYSAIEARVLAWLAGQTDILDVFRTGADVYVYTAAKIYRVPFDDVTKAQRFAGKVAVLALGFQGGHRALMSMAGNYGADLDEREAHAIKNQWREANRCIVKYWYACEDAVVDVVTGNLEKGETFKRVGATRFSRAGRFLVTTLPSGRKLRHYAPRYNPESGTLSYMGIDANTRKWCRKTTYGGDIAQTITQATARDLMADAMLRATAAGAEIVLTVHDEIVAERISAARLSEIMEQAPVWAAGLPIATEGKDVRRYEK